MIKVYIMPNGKRYRYEESEAPKEAKLIGEEKKAEPKNKAVRPANKARKATKK